MQGMEAHVSKLASVAEVERMLRRLLPDLAPLPFQQAMRVIRVHILSRLEWHAGWDAIRHHRLVQCT